MGLAIRRVPASVLIRTTVLIARTGAIVSGTGHSRDWCRRTERHVLNRHDSSVSREQNEFHLNGTYAKKGLFTDLSTTI